MSNHKARFRGDVQIDGSLLGSDGEPIDLGGGGSFDPTVPIPELHFAGDPIDDSSGMSIAWDEDLWGLAFRQPLGADDAEIYLVSSDNPDSYLNMYPGGLYTTYGSSRVGLNGGGLDLQYAAAHISLDNGNYNRIVMTPDPSRQATDYGALLISRPGDSGAFDMVSFVLMHDGSMRWGPGGYVPQDTHLTRTAPGTLEIDHTLSFKGADSDPLAGATLSWDDSLYGLVLKGRPGSNDAELYIVDPDNSDTYLNAYCDGFIIEKAPYGRVRAIPGSLITDNYTRTRQFRAFANDDAAGFQITGPDGLAALYGGRGPGMIEISQPSSTGISGIVCHSPDGTAYKLTPPNGGGPAEWVAA